MANSEMNCSAFDEMIEAYLDGELSAEDVRVIELHVTECPVCAEELSLAQKVSEGLAELTPLDCPDVVTARVRHTLSALEERTSSNAAGDRTRGALWSKNFWQIAAAVVLLAAGIVLAILQSKDPEPIESASVNETYTSEEVALARKQLEWTLAYVDHVTRSSLRSVGEDVIGRRITPSVKSAVGILLALDGRESNTIQ